MSSTQYQRLTLLVQTGAILLFEQLLNPSWVYMSAFGPHQGLPRLPVALIPLLLLASSFLSPRARPTFYLLTALLLLNNPVLIVGLLALSGLIFLLSGMRIHSRPFTAILLIGTSLLIFGSHWLQSSQESTPLMWIWLMIHLSWGLKMVAWIVTVRIYRSKLNSNQFLDYFFNPAFFFFTNDLNVLTPKRFLDSNAQPASFGAMDAAHCVKGTALGLLLILGYGAIQRYYFMNLDDLGRLGASPVGGVVSVITAIVFHAANVFIQISLLNSMGYKLAVDMDRPWLATSPIDYWRRMHYYVREYIFDIIIKPTLTSLLRFKATAKLGSILIMVLIYLLFTSTQIGYQPFRQDRSVGVGLLVTGIFIAMIAIPELLPNRLKHRLFGESAFWGRLVTFSILTLGYSLIFFLRQGF